MTMIHPAYNGLPGFANPGRSLRCFLVSMLAALAVVLPCRASDLVYIAGPHDPRAAQAQVDLASQFYGAQVQVIRVDAHGDARSAMEALKQPETLAAVISVNSLPYLEQHQVLSALSRSGRNTIPLLLVGAVPETSPKLLRSWSGGAVQACNPPAHEPHSWTLSVGDQKDLVRELSGIAMPFQGAVACGFAPGKHSGARPLLEASDQSIHLPMFIDATVDGQRVFFLANTIPSGEASASPTGNFVMGFSRIAADLMYVRFALGDRAWHPPAHYANFTVDDAWLTEPFGNLNYTKLLQEMEKHNFHTTIAFIPWNYDRSRPGPVALFLGHPDRFSICVHGNNHDHREFGDYGAQTLAGQAANIRQALARMDQFTKLTRIPYSRVMVFPHAVAPVETFGVLKEYNFWATTNSENVPLGSHPPAAALFPFRPETLDFADFLSIFRYSAEVPVSSTAIAINEYLGNPVLFYGHEGFFHRGIDAFDGVADEVNRIEPESKWENLGSITQHLYLVRARQDRDYDVLSFSPDFVLANDENRTVAFHVRKPENFVPAIASFNVDGHAQPYESLKTEISFTVSVQPGSRRHVEILYANDLKTSPADLSKGGLQVRLLRWVSDFRDLKLSKSKPGWAAMNFYYDHHLDDVERAGEPWAIRLVFLTVLLVALLWLRRQKRGVAGS